MGKHLFGFAVAAILLAGCARPAVDLGFTPTPRPTRVRPTFTPVASATAPTPAPVKLPVVDPNRKYGAGEPGSAEILSPGEFLWIFPSEKVLDARTYTLVEYEGKWALAVDLFGGFAQRIEKRDVDFEGYPRDILGADGKVIFRAGPLTYLASGEPVLGVYLVPGVKALIQRPIVEGKGCELDLEPVWTPHQPGLLALGDKFLGRDRVEQFDSGLLLDINPAPILLTYDEGARTFRARWLGYPGSSQGFFHEGQYVRLSILCHGAKTFQEYLWAGAARKWFKIVP